MKRVVTILSLTMLLFCLTACSAAYAEDSKTVTLYDNQGGVIKVWDETKDIIYRDQEVRFNSNDKYFIIHGGIVVIEEY